jgi:hypothetical protein
LKKIPGLYSAGFANFKFVLFSILPYKLEIESKLDKVLALVAKGNAEGDLW